MNPSTVRRPLCRTGLIVEGSASEMKEERSHDQCVHDFRESRRPASCKVRAALSPAIPAPMTAMWVMFLLLWRLTRAGCTADTKTLSLVLTFVLRPGEFEGDVGHVIPGVVDADEQQQHRCRGDDEQCRCWIAWKQKRRDDEPGIGDERQDRM